MYAFADWGKSSFAYGFSDGEIAYSPSSWYLFILFINHLIKCIINLLVMKTLQL